MKSRPSYGYSPEEFAKVWNESDSVDTVSAVTKIPKASCLSKASMLRSRGLTLKKFKRGRKACTTQKS